MRRDGRRWLAALVSVILALAGVGSFAWAPSGASVEPASSRADHTYVYDLAATSTTTATTARVGMVDGYDDPAHPARAGTRRSAVSLAPKVGAASKKVAIGEDMERRVKPYAKRTGSETFEAPPGLSRDELMSANRKWINDRMDEGCLICDIGPAPGRANFPEPTSPFYRMELDEIARRGYSNYRRAR